MSDTFFQTTSFNIAAWLVSNDYEIKDHVKINGRTIFIFERSEKLDKIIESYNQNETIKRFVGSYKIVKELAMK